MKTLVITKSKWGSTTQYADWIREETNADITSENKSEASRLVEYDTIILVSRTYMGKIQLSGFLKTNWDSAKGKNVVLVAVGMIPEEKSRDSFELIPEEIRAGLVYFKVPGRIEVKNLNFLEKKIVKMISGELKDEDKVRKDHLKPVLDYLKDLA